MRLTFVTVDVFTDRAFGGNPLAVVLDASGLTSAQMQAIAAEFNLAETTFVLPPKDPSHTAQVRIFTPRAEMPFAGHPNVGTAFALAREGTCHGRPVGAETMVFEELAGLVPMEMMRKAAPSPGRALRRRSRSRSARRWRRRSSPRPAASPPAISRRATMRRALQAAARPSCSPN